MRAAAAPHVDDNGFPSPDGTAPDAPLQWPGTELHDSAHFTDVEQSVIPRRLTMSASDYLGHLSTISAYLVLPDPVRHEVFARTRDVLPQQVELRADIMVHLARRAAASGIVG